MQDESPFPIYNFTSEVKHTHTLTVLTSEEATHIVPASELIAFQNNGSICHNNITYLTPTTAAIFTIQKNCTVIFSKGVEKEHNYFGIASSLLASAYRFSRHSITKPVLEVSVQNSAKNIHQILRLVDACIQTKQWANSRGNVDGVPSFFVAEAERIASETGLKLQVLIGEELLANGLRMFNAVGRASIHKPVLINLSYHGNIDSQQWTAFIGKGVCFDTGGLNLKSTANIQSMFLDKHGACSCLAAFQQIAKQKLKINLTVTVGFCQNSVGSRSYRPSDILTSRKGITVEVADTDAEGRLILADLMNWTQQKYKVKRMVELSTLTYSCMAALGQDYAGIFGNNNQFSQTVRAVGVKVNQLGWILPLTDKHHRQLQSKVADCCSDVDQMPGASIAAAFLQKFVEPETIWVHLDIGGVSIIKGEGSGYGARLLLQLARQISLPK